MQTRAKQSPSWFFYVDVLVALVCVVWSACLLAQSSSVRDTSSAADIVGPSWPFHLAAFHFSLQFVVCGALTLALFSQLPGARMPLGSMIGELAFLSRCQEATCLMSFIGFVAATTYATSALSSHHYIGAFGWFQGVEEPRMLHRYLLWSISAPSQWIILTRLCTLATPIEIAQIVVPTVSVMQLGLLASAAGEVSGVLLAHQMHRLCFILSSLYCLLVFKRVFALKPEPSLVPAWYLGVAFLGCMWVAFPALQLLRTFGYVSSSNEHLVTPILDIIAKTLIALSIASKSVVTQLLSVMFSVQIANASQDLILTVKEPGWEIVGPRSDMEAAVMENLIGRPTGRLNFLEDMVQIESQRRALLQAAEQADSMGNFTAQKVCADLVLPNDCKANAECFISRSLYGVRQVSMVIHESEFSEGPGSSEEKHWAGQEPKRATFPAAQTMLAAATQQVIKKREKSVWTKEESACSGNSQHLDDIIKQAEELLDEPRRLQEEQTPSVSSGHLSDVIKTVEEMIDHVNRR